MTIPLPASKVRYEGNLVADSMMLDSLDSILEGALLNTAGVVFDTRPAHPLHAQFDYLVQSLDEADDLFGIFSQTVGLTSIANQIPAPVLGNNSDVVFNNAFSVADFQQPGKTSFDIGPATQQLVEREFANVNSKVILASASTAAYSTSPGFYSVVETEASQQITGRAIAQQAIESIPNNFSKGLEQKQMIQLRINPPELGRMSIQVEFHAGQIAAQITVSDSLAAELLAHEKEFLLDSLANAGFKGADVDISHGFFENDESSQHGATDSNTTEFGSAETTDFSDYEIQHIGLNLLA